MDWRRWSLPSPTWRHGPGTAGSCRTSWWAALFSITNGGVFGSLLSTPLLNYPQSAILGMHTIQRRPIAEEGPGGEVVVVRPMMYLALTYDHRLIDGKEAVSYLKRVKELVEDPWRLFIEA